MDALYQTVALGDSKNGSLESDFIVTIDYSSFETHLSYIFHEQVP